jgi:hypothetical protein
MLLKHWMSTCCWKVTHKHSKPILNDSLKRVKKRVRNSPKRVNPTQNLPNKLGAHNPTYLGG